MSEISCSLWETWSNRLLYTLYLRCVLTDYLLFAITLFTIAKMKLSHYLPWFYYVLNDI